MEMSSLTDNKVTPFKVGDSPVRGRVVQLGSVIDKILIAHDFGTNVSELVGETAVLAALMGAALKFDGKLIFQIQGNGPLSLVVADYAADGALRAMASVHGVPGEAGFEALLGKGHIAITIDQGADMERYQGVTPIEGEKLEKAAVAYFMQSEQIPTIIRLAVGKISRPGAGDEWRAGGIMAQFIPAEGGTRERGEEILKSEDDKEMWDRAAAFVESTQADELLDPSISTDTLLYRLFHEDGVRVFEPTGVRAECGCNAEKIGAVLSKYSEADLADMVEDGFIRVSCEFCRTSYLFDKSGTHVSSQ